MVKLYNVSSSPHVRDKLSTGNVMLDVIIALMPATIMGMIHFGLPALIVVCASVASAVLTEFLFNLITKRKQTVGDFSAVVTGLLLALTLPAELPVYIPILGSAFAIFFVKCVFGGLGKNFMNPALTGRCFLLISFGAAMTRYSVDSVTMATPLANMVSGQEVTWSMLLDMYIGRGSGCIGNSVGALLIGAAYLWMTSGLTMEVPVAVIASFTAFVAIFGEEMTFMTLLAHILGGGIIIGAFFFATDPVTNPTTTKGRIIFGCLVGILSGIFRVYGTAPDSVSYAVVTSNLFVPFIDRYVITKPYGYRKKYMNRIANGGVKVKGDTVPKGTVVLGVITLVAGLALAGSYQLTKNTIELRKAEEAAASYKEVCPQADRFRKDSKLDAKLDAVKDAVYGTDFGKSYIREAWVAVDASGKDCGYVICVASNDAFDGSMAFSVGFGNDGTVSGISFTELHDTAGMGLLCGEPKFKDQFVGVKTDAYVLDKTGELKDANAIDTVTGASISSGAVVNAVNAALDFLSKSKGE
ncbi:MAG: RnfABCDGE type electron transport complex subunit D [Lachnospiraceae bacterium]|nr:RnfABCDGE type electron transport complex subunit D [Lachnospiraceae bacterium]